MATTTTKDANAKKKDDDVEDAIKRRAAAAEEADEDEKDEDEESEDSDDSPASSRPSGGVKATPVPVAEGGAGRGFKNVMTIAARELRSYFDSLVAYVVLGGSMLGMGFYFFVVTTNGTFWQVDRATMARMFEFMPLALSYIVIPLVTMRALAEEKRSGTLELLITMPVRDSEVILGKYLGAVALVLVLYVATLIYPIAMFIWPWQLGPLDWGPIAAGYTGLVLFALAGVALGLMFSSITESQIIAFFLTAGVLALLHILGMLSENAHGWLGEVGTFLSFPARFSGFARGLIDSKAVIYFLSIAVVCLLIAFRSLERRKWS